MTKQLLTPDQYMDLLLERQAAHEADHPPVGWVRTLPTWFIQDGDEHLVDMGAVERSTPSPRPARAKRPRKYRPASYWQAELDRIETRLAAIDGIQRHDTDDPAAYGGIGIRQTARQARRYGARIDKAAAEHVRLEGRKSHAVRMLRAAQKREAAGVGAVEDAETSGSSVGRGRG